MRIVCGQRPKAGGITGQHGPVLTVLRQHVQLDEQTVRRPGIVDPANSRNESHAGGRIHWPSLVFAYDVIAVSGKCPYQPGETKAIPDMGKASREQVRVLVASFVRCRQMKAFRGSREQADGTAHRAIAEYAGGGSS